MAEQDKRPQSAPRANNHDGEDPEVSETEPAVPRDAESASADDGLVDLSSMEAAEELSPDEDPLALLEGEIASLKDQLLRAMAETENVRNRARREREESVKYAAVPLIKDLLAVADNLQRALASVAPDAARENEQLQSLLTGVELTEKEIRSVFERHKIETIDPLGEQLDPHFHEAMFEIPDPAKPAGTVVQVIQVGYRLHDRLLRPARVAIAKAPVEASEDAAGKPAEDSGVGNGLDARA